MPSIGPYRCRADSIAVAVECREKSNSAVPRHGIQAPKCLFLDEERPFQCTVIAGKPYAAPRRIVSSAEIGKFECHYTMTPSRAFAGALLPRLIRFIVLKCCDTSSRRRMCLLRSS